MSMVQAACAAAILLENAMSDEQGLRPQDLEDCVTRLVVMLQSVGPAPARTIYTPATYDNSLEEWAAQALPTEWPGDGLVARNGTELTPASEDPNPEYEAYIKRKLADFDPEIERLSAILLASGTLADQALAKLSPYKDLLNNQALIDQINQYEARVRKEKVLGFK